MSLFSKITVNQLDKECGYRLSLLLLVYYGHFPSYDGISDYIFKAIIKLLIKVLFSCFHSETNYLVIMLDINSG